ncbi:hypothetical protein A8975_0430 [Meridianimaribacter flavus]|uniref:Uncharacterized protein n=2 Tax=Meridianimaribacter flavus TaxID=571115 RepID=A0ABY2G7S1_9FLAO|nr:hypothetical protein A8975_0430 [Meridianimaribacter flavus]
MLLLMKKLKHTLLLVFVGFTVTLTAQTDCGEDTGYGETEVEMLGNKICLSIDINFGYDDAGEKIENIFLAHLGITRKTPNYKQQILELWNTYSNCFVCKSKSVTKPELPYPTHFLKRVVDFNMEPQVFDQFLLEDPEEFPIDVNAVELVDDKSETLIDYLDKIIADPSRHKDYRLTVIKELRTYLIEDYGAKTAAELEKEKD